MYLKVTQRGSIIAASPDRRRLKSGTKLDKDQCLKLFGGQKEVDRLVEQGYLVRMYDQMDPDEHPLPPQVNTVQQTHPHPEEIDMSKGGKPMTTEPKGRVPTVQMPRMRPTPVVEVQPPTVTMPPVEQPTIVTVNPGPWDLDPAALTGRDVNELNVMIAERSPKPMLPFETVEEAAAWLSQNFQAATAEEAVVSTD